jgi:hypothetical protein
MVKHKNNFDLGKESEFTRFSEKKQFNYVRREQVYENSNSASISTPGVSMALRFQDF